jgi:tRNA (pseudouridine54-N1)-methyltransferase
MREFVIVGHDAPTTPDFSLSDLPGAGRLDVLCRCVTSAFCLSHDLRDAVRVHLVLADTYVVNFDGSELRHLHPDERSAASLIRGALEHRDGAIGARAAEASPGVTIRRGGFDDALDSLPESATVVALRADGDPITDLEPPDHPAFVLSDHRSFADAEGEHLAGVADEWVAVGPAALHADQTVTVAHNYLDTDGYSRYRSR